MQNEEWEVTSLRLTPGFHSWNFQAFLANSSIYDNLLASVVYYQNQAFHLDKAFQLETDPEVRQDLVLKIQSINQYIIRLKARTEDELMPIDNSVSFSVEAIR